MVLGLDKMYTNRYFINSYENYDATIKNVVNKKIQMKIIALAKQALSFADSKKQLEGGIYVGGAGITYMWIHMNRFGLLKLSSTENSVCNEKAQRALEAQQSYFNSHTTRKNGLPAFLLGKAGVDAVAAVFHHANGDLALSRASLQEYASLALYCKPINFLSAGSDELFVGRAGYLCGALWLQEIIGTPPVLQKDLKEIWLGIIESGTKYSATHKSPCPLMYAYHNTEYLGAAHGLSAILQILLSFPIFCNEYPDKMNRIKETIDFYLTLQTSSGNFFPELTDIRDGYNSGSNELVHFCHGAPGAIYMLAKAYLTFKEQKYLDACTRCAELIWGKGLLRKGPGICHGVAGNGYAFLLLYRLTNDSSYLYKATKFAEFLEEDIFQSKSRVPDNPYSLYEGMAGTVCFLADLIDPTHATFPFFNVFYNYVPDPLPL